MTLDTHLADLTASTGHLIASGRYAVDPAHTRIGFVARHAMISKVRGSFGDFGGTGCFDADDPAASHLELAIRTASIDTGNPDRDAHLRSSDFLAIADHPTITFVSTDVRWVGENTYRVTGDLTLRGVVGPVVVDFECTGAIDDPDVGERYALEGTAAIDRKDWGVSWNSNLDAGGVLVGDRVLLEFDVSIVRLP